MPRSPGRQLAPDVVLPDETGDGPPPRRPARPLDRPVLLSRRTTRPAATPRRASSATSTATTPRPTPTSGASARTAPRATAVPREVRPAVHAPVGPGPRGHRALRRVGREDGARPDVHGHRPLDVPDRPRRPDRPRLAEGQGRRPPGRGARRRSARSGRPRLVMRRRRLMTEAVQPQEPHAWRPDRFMVIAAHPDDADFGPAATAAALDRPGLRRLARVLHQRRRRAPRTRHRPARARRAPRARAAGRGRGRRLRGRDASCTCPTARSSTT